jgi:hypothetical protein
MGLGIEWDWAFNVRGFFGWCLGVLLDLAYCMAEARHVLLVHRLSVWQDPLDRRAENDLETKISGDLHRR